MSVATDHLLWQQKGIAAWAANIFRVLASSSQESPDSRKCRFPRQRYRKWVRVPRNAPLLLNNVAYRNLGQSLLTTICQRQGRLRRSICLTSLYTRKIWDEERARLGIWLVFMSLSAALDSECSTNMAALQCRLLAIGRVVSHLRTWMTVWLILRNLAQYIKAGSNVVCNAAKAPHESTGSGHRLPVLRSLTSWRH